MAIEGVHHITAITGDAPRNVDFYARLLGLRMVKKTVNFDAPDVYHLYYGDELGHPGSAMTFFEFPGAPRGRAGAGMVHRVTWRVRDSDALDFWAARVGNASVAVQRGESSLGFSDPEGLGLELVVAGAVPDPPLAASSAEVPPEHALLGFDGVRAFSARPDASRALFSDTLGFTSSGDDAWLVAGEVRRSGYAFDAAPPPRGMQGAGTVHHVAWASEDADHAAWRERALD